MVEKGGLLRLNGDYGTVCMWSKDAGYEGGLIVQGFWGEEEDLKVGALGDREPMQFEKDGGNVVTGAGE